MQIRIAALEKEEELAKKKIDEARLKAIGMLQKQLQKEENNKKLQEIKTLELSKAQAKIQAVKNDEANARNMRMLIEERNKSIAQLVKNENKYL